NTDRRKLAVERTLLQGKHMIRKDNAHLALRAAFAACALSFLVAGAAAISPAHAGTATTTLGVSLTINAGCNVSSSSVAFPTQTVLASGVSQRGSVSVTCTNTTPYNVGLDP